MPEEDLILLLDSFNFDNDEPHTGTPKKNTTRFLEFLEMFENLGQ